MSHSLRFRSGQVELHRLRVAAETVLEPGDLVWLDGDDLKPAADFPFDTDLDTTRAAFAAVFLGVCQQYSAAGDTADVSVDLSPLAVYEFDCDAATFEVGSLLAPDGDSEALFSRKLAKVTDPAVAIARAAEYQAGEATRIRVQFASAFHPASANRNALIGGSLSAPGEGE
jgi:hypothetical protein